MATKQDYQKRNKALSAIVAVLLAIVMCASVVLGVGFGVYGKNTDDWFKNKTQIKDKSNPNNRSNPLTTAVRISKTLQESASFPAQQLHLRTARSARR